MAIPFRTVAALATISALTAAIPSRAAEVTPGDKAAIAHALDQFALRHADDPAALERVRRIKAALAAGNFDPRRDFAIVGNALSWLAAPGSVYCALLQRLSPSAICAGHDDQ